MLDATEAGGKEGSGGSWLSDGGAQDGMVVDAEIVGMEIEG